MREIRFALKHTVPILFEYVFIGLSFGILMADIGYSPLWSVFSALTVYAGSMQLVMVSLLKVGTPLPAVAFTALAVNARHIFYGIGFVEKFRRMGWRFPFMVFSLTDEAYSILCSVRYEDGMDEDRAAFFISLFTYLYWAVSCFMGGIIGHMIPWDMTGIDFSATVFFFVVILNQWQQYKSKVPALTGIICAVMGLLVIGPENFLVPALAVSLLVLIFVRDRISERLVSR